MNYEQNTLPYKQALNAQVDNFINNSVQQSKYQDMRKKMEQEFSKEQATLMNKDVIQQ